ncbi:hypothetical protein [Magnetospirillum sp. SS-4]|uniref:hypothetical protein n=1 Tax=Magnetospirillum sp. SS-4 TaxID=2681465 RepID=UPI00157221BF|nr:hypothetical protein [Magnetospirillum sp. SS-4]
MNIEPCRNRGLSRRLLYRSPALVRVLQIAGMAYRIVPVGAPLTVLVEDRGERGHADLVVVHNGAVLVIERFSGRDVAKFFQAAVGCCLTRWRQRGRPHTSVSLKILVPPAGLCYHRPQP